MDKIEKTFTKAQLEELLKIREWGLEWNKKQREKGESIDAKRTNN